jgi:uroporphyrinogen decarboxylase
MVNKVSPKNGLSKKFFKDEVIINEILNLLDKFIKIHIENQIKAGATIIQIFDSWAGLIQNDFDKFLYNPTLSLVNHVKNLGVPVICFPRGITDYVKFTKIVNPSMINIDYNVDPEILIKSLDVPVQGGLDPKILLSDKENLKKQIRRYLNIFKDHPYVFNLGHGILPETEVEMVYELVETVRNYK